MAGKEIIFGQKARDGINTGIQLACKAVASTFGPRGRTVAYTKGTNTITTKDGISVLKSLSFSNNEVLDTGLKLLKEAADKANMHSGDGSTSTTILTASLCNEANRLLTQGIDINDLRYAFKQASKDVLDSLKKYKKDIESEETIKNIALVSSNGDEEVAQFVTDAFTSIGDGGLVSYADSMSRTGKTVLEIKQGLQIDKGYISSKCVNSTNDQCILNDVNIILFNDMVDGEDAVEKFPLLIQTLKGKSVLVIAPEYSEEIISMYLKSFVSNGIVFIKAPGMSRESISSNIQDIAVMTNGKIIGIDLSLDEFNPLKDCGHCGTATLTNKETIITDPATDENAFNEHIELLKKMTEEGDCIHGKSQFQIDVIKERIARLTGGIATIYIGALTSVELSEKKDRYDDAINAVRNSLAEGILVGAGTTLLRISYDNAITKSACKNMSISQQTAYKAFMKAIRAPAKRLILSTGEDTEVVIPEILKNENNGFNARTAKVEKIIEKGIVDPYAVVKNSIIYSTNMAEQFMSIDTIIVSDVKNMSIEALDEVVDPGRMFESL